MINIYQRAFIKGFQKEAREWQHFLYGALPGAAIGGIYEALRNKEKGEESHYLRNMLIGGLLGGGANYLYPVIGETTPKKKQTPVTREQVPTTKTQVPTTKTQVPTTKTQVPTTKKQVPTTKTQVTAPTIKEQITTPEKKRVVPSIKKRKLKLTQNVPSEFKKIPSTEYKTISGVQEGIAFNISNDYLSFLANPSSYSRHGFGVFFKRSPYLQSHYTSKMKPITNPKKQEVIFNKIFDRFLQQVMWLQDPKLVYNYSKHMFEFEPAIAATLLPLSNPANYQSFLSNPQRYKKWLVKDYWKYIKKMKAAAKPRLSHSFS